MLDGLSNANKSYPGRNYPPRKDFGPQSGQEGYNFPYQSNNPPTWGPTPPGPRAPTNLPGNMQLITYDLVDAATSILNALNKMENVIKNYPGLSEDKYEKLIKLATRAQKIVLSISDLDSLINKEINISGEQPQVNPQQEKEIPF